MPMHYSAARYESSLRTKHIVRLAMEKLLAHESWETIPTETYAEALEYARQNVDKVLKQESKVIWAAPLTKAEMQGAFSAVGGSQAQGCGQPRRGTSHHKPRVACLRCRHLSMGRC